ncbi:FGGY family carbohydrate kinase, partial [Escherichia sp. TWPC-MK]
MARSVACHHCSGSCSEQGEVVASQTEKLTVSRPHPLWSEQDPEQWWQATDRPELSLRD